MNDQDSKRRIESLRRQIEHHNDLYYQQAAPEISDRYYDALVRELADLERQHPELATAESPTRRVGGQPLDEFVTRPHSRPMLSLANTYNREELEQFFRRVYERAGRSDLAFTVEPKIDGVSISIRYEEGILTQALTRGNGREGDDVTANVRTIRGLPLRLGSAAPPALVEARGEVFMTRRGFEELNQKREARGERLFANARNAAAGSLKLLDPREVARRPLDLRFYAQAEWEGTVPPTQEALMANFFALGLPCCEFFEIRTGFEAVWDAVQFLDTQRCHFPYDIDGAVIKVNDFSLRDAIGVTAKAPSWAIAFKYEAERALTRLNSVSVQVGRTGVLTPVAELEPVSLAGSTIRRATLHNQDEIDRKDIRIGDAVVIEKAGEVIPAVVEVEKELRAEGTQPFNMIEHIGGECPSCGKPVFRDAEFVAWQCTNLGCPAQAVGRLEHFARRNALDIDQLGGVVARSLVERGWVLHPLDLFTLREEQLADLNLGTPEQPRQFGEKNARKLLQSVERSRALPLERWLHALGIPHVGVSTAGQLARLHASLADLAESPLLRMLMELHELAEEMKTINPRARKNPPADSGERAERRRRYLECQQKQEELTAAASRLEAGVKSEEIGAVVARSVLDFFSSENGQQLLRRLDELNIHPSSEPTENVQQSESPLHGRKLVLTGTLQSMSRTEATQEIEGRGGTVTSAVSGNTDFVVAGNDPGNSKIRKARSNNVPVLSEEDLLTMLKGDAQGSAAEPGPETEPAEPSPVDRSVPPADLFSWADQNRDCSC